MNATHRSGGATTARFDLGHELASQSFDEAKEDLETRNEELTKLFEDAKAESQKTQARLLQVQSYAQQAITLFI